MAWGWPGAGLKVRVFKFIYELEFGGTKEGVYICMLMRMRLALQQSVTTQLCNNKLCVPDCRQ